MVACFSLASISSFASREEPNNANAQEAQPDSCNINVCDSINMPVFIVDGVEVQVQDLDSTLTQDAVSMQVIKDPAITKIFSPRLGGVILITTRSKRFLTPVLENYNRSMEEKERNRIPGQILIRGSVNENGNDSISGNSCSSKSCDSIKHRVLFDPHQKPYYLNGGGDGFLNDLYTALSKTVPLSQDSIKGRAVFNFYILKDGIIDPNSINLLRNKSLPENYINAAVEAIKSLGKFEPGKLDGVPVRVSYTVAIRFPIPLDRIKTDTE